MSVEEFEAACLAVEGAVEIDRERNSALRAKGCTLVDAARAAGRDDLARRVGSAMAGVYDPGTKE